MSELRIGNVVRCLAPRASLRVSRVIYRCGGAQPSSLRDLIPLGVFVDARVDDVLYGLGLMTRASVAEQELDRVARLAKPLVAEPFAYLSHEFDRVLTAADPERAFIDLPKIHSTALLACPSKESAIELPRHLRALPGSHDVLRAWTEDTLTGFLRREFWALLDEHWPRVDYDGRREEHVRLAA